MSAPLLTKVKGFFAQARSRVKTPHLKLPAFKLPLLHRPVSHTRKSTAIALLTIGLLIVVAGGGWAANFFIRQQAAKPRVYLLELQAPNSENGRYLLQNHGEVTAKVTFPQYSKLPFSEQPEVRIQALLDDQAIFQKVENVLNNKTQVLETTISIPLDFTNATEGEHILKVQVHEDGKSLVLMAEKTLIVVNDHSAPELVAATIPTGTLSRYQLDSDKQASRSAGSGLKLITNSKGPIALSLGFSESVKPELKISTDTATLEVADTTAASVSATLTAKANQFTAPFSFKDLAGNSWAGELQYVYDGQAPTFKTSTDWGVYDNTDLKNFFLTFQTSEAMAFVRATVNGVTKTGKPSSQNYYGISGLPLTQDVNNLKLTGQDLAGNPASLDITVKVIHPGITPGYSAPRPFPTSLPENVRKCTDEDKRICGYENVSEMTCEEFFVVKKCLQDRCSRDGFYLGSCEDN